VHWQAFPESKPTGVEDAEALAQGVRILERRNANTGPVDGVWGGAETEQIQDLVDFLVSSGVIDEEVEIDNVWTDELLEKINDFDEEAIRQEAREWSEG
jgi:NitT/TauT family transport system substrate-binding protein